MIVDRIEAMDKYCATIPHLAEALSIIRENPYIGEGKRYFDGGYMFFQAADTRPAEDGTFEAHRDYLDLQILLDGMEYILWNHIANMEVVIPYNAEKDREDLSGEGTTLLMKPGMCCLLFPQDAHKACRHIEQPGRYEKLVVKLKLQK